MHPFTYARPDTVREAVALLAEHAAEAAILAGGTDLIVALRDWTAQPRLVVDIKHIRDLPAGVFIDGGWLRIGAATTMATVESDGRVLSGFPALAEAARTVGSVQIRNRATLAGNVCHASPAADTVPPLLAYGAMIRTESVGGTRRVPATEFFTGPGRTVLEPGEVVTSVDLPLAAEPRGAAFARLTRRRGVDLATVNLCCLVDGSGRARFAYGAVAPTAFLVSEETGVLADEAADVGIKTEALQRLISHSRPISDVRASREYREAMLLTMSRRALAVSLERLKVAQGAA